MPDPSIRENQYFVCLRNVVTMVETGGGGEDGLNLGNDEERACTSIGSTNYVALFGEGRGT